ncbi:hypothetical protein ABB07_38075 [Streptomyces incarnatus]|uniref:N-acetyltransferase domain-containing protein n=1 Tax=Streptomyces incarnatus TaxID=665007 RepID=A0ABN4GPE3_9ACTN|nr:GNAT family N-acetyltransferase [Streptomyces incarnatus]AKJ15665.1 hypothetical protein ABB07_38075 [Streptomyces incarnatus]
MPCWPTEPQSAYGRQVRLIVQRCSGRQATERVAKGVRPGYRALAAEYDGRLVGLAEYEVLPGGSTAEISMTVADGWHHRGAATLVLEHLADAAHMVGITVRTPSGRHLAS